MFLADLAVMVFDAVGGGGLRPHHLDQFRALVGPVQAGGDEDQDVAAGDALLLQGAQDRRQEQTVRHGPRHVADEDAGVFAAARDLGQRTGADGAPQGFGHGGGRVGERSGRADRQRPDDAVVRQVHVEAGAAVIKMNAHGGSGSRENSGAREVKIIVAGRARRFNP